MPRHIRPILALALLVAGLLPAAAQAHGGNPSFRSVFRQIAPPMPGVTARVLGYDEYYQVTSTAKRTVTIYGYEGEPYLRILPDHTTQQNENSPALYLNVDRLGTAPVPAHAKRGAPVVWQTIDKTGRLTWHDHRMHWMSTSKPPQVHDVHRRTKIFDYRIPISEGSARGAIEGTLYWVGPAGGSFPLVAALILVLLVVGGGVLVYVVRRRRATVAPDAAPPEAW